jgi:dolichyl-phosphate-mannose-protein mannosyltransferase
MKIKAVVISLVVLLLLCGIQPSVSAQNLLQNGDFESVAAGKWGAGWAVDFWKPGSKTGITDQKSHTGKYAAFVQAKEANDLRLVQKISVEPDTVYRFSGWVATRQVTPGGNGANLCVMGGFNHSNVLTGDNEWQQLEMVFRTRPNQHEVTLGVRLGFYGGLVSGLVYFDDLNLEKINNPQTSYLLLDEPTLNFQPADLTRQPELTQPDEALNSVAAVGRKLSMLFGFPVWVALFYLLWLAGVALYPEKSSGAWLQPDFNRIVKAKTGLLFAGGVLLALLIRLPLLPAIPFATDMGNFKAWTLRILETGPLGFYAPGYYCDYPPFSLYILWGAGWLAKLTGLIAREPFFNSIIKLPSFLSDVATAWLILTIVKKKDYFLGLLLAVIYLFIPAVIYNSAYWGQVDSYYVFLVLAAFYLTVYKDAPEWAAALLAASFLTKAQTIAFIPLFLCYLFLNYNWKRWLRIIGAGIAAFILIILPFNLGHAPGWIFDLFFKQAELYPYASMNAGNFIALLNGNNASDALPVLPGISFRTAGLLLFGLSVLWSLGFYLRKRTPASFMAALTVSSFAFFMFFPRMHERYLFPALAFMLITIGFYKDKRLFFLTGIFGLSYLLNMHAVILKFQNLFSEEMFNRIIYILGMVHTGIFLAIWGIFQLQLPGENRNAKRLFGRYRRGFHELCLNSLAVRVFTMTRRDYLTVGLVALVYCGLLFFRLGSWSTPQTGINFATAESGIEVDFRYPASPRTVIWYDAEENGTLRVEQWQSGSWRELATLTCNDYYVLKRQPVTADQVERIRLIPQPTAGCLKEIAFLDSAGQLIPIKSVIGLTDRQRQNPARYPLFDEQKLVLAQPSSLNSTYFDEIYHGRTAYEFVARTNVYETTHPPLGKDLLSLGILLFGMNPFGMRFMHAVAGVLLIIALFFLGRQVLGTRFGGYATMMLGFLDFMPFVQSRYATIDTTSVLLITLMFIFTFRYIRGELDGVSSGRSLANIAAVIVCFALAAGVKWTAIYGFAGVTVSIILFKCFQYRENKKRLAITRENVKMGKKINAGKKNMKVTRNNQRGAWRRYFGKPFLQWFLLFLLVAPAIYYFTYIPFLHCAGMESVVSKSGLSRVLENQQSMFSYHSQLTATHPFESKWWGWPFNYKPLWIYSGNSVQPGCKATIVSMGNPLIWSLGVGALTLLIYQLLRRRKFSLMLLVLVGFFSLYLPWVLVSRATFIYHYFPALPLLYLMIAAVLEPLWRMEKPGRAIIYGLAGVALLLWIMFYPALSGLAAPEKYLQALRWFSKDWLF